MVDYLAPSIAATASVTVAVLGPNVANHLQNRIYKKIAAAGVRNFEILKKLEEHPELRAFHKDVLGILGLQLTDLFEAAANAFASKSRD
jgi:hypothetical protein